MASSVKTHTIHDETGVALLDTLSDVALTPRDSSTLKLVYGAMRHVDELKQNRGTAFASLVQEAIRLISIGDSGQAMIYLAEAHAIDPKSPVTSQNMMIALYNCGVELYNGRHFSEAKPVLKKCVELSRKFGSPGEIQMMARMQQNCIRLANEKKEADKPMGLPALQAE
jgi:hypothetical protein